MGGSRRKEGAGGRERNVSLPRTGRRATAKELERAVGMKAMPRKKIRGNCLLSLWEVG